MFISSIHFYAYFLDISLPEKENIFTFKIISSTGVIKHKPYTGTHLSEKSVMVFLAPAG